MVCPDSPEEEMQEVKINRIHFEATFDPLLYRVY